MDDIENLRRFFGFIGLQVADEMVARTLAIGEFPALGIEFLNVVFAEVAQAERVGFADRRGRELFGDRNQLNVGTAASGARGRLRDTKLYLV